MVSRGNFVLYDGIVPPLEAGDYELEAKQVLNSDDTSGLDTATHRSRIRVTSPRYKLPPDQILTAFPPANSEGAYESRLPQIVIRRRTLPWERLPHRSGDPEVDAEVDTNTPWLALVVIAEGEGELSPESPIDECVTAGVPMEGPKDVVKGVYLAVPESTVNKVFPTIEDLRLLTHVREVNLEDTEHAMGDDDGFMAVVLANRLPQYDRVQCKPVRYTACLINLEGQLHVLPPPTPPIPTFVATAHVFDAELAVLQAQQNDPDLQLMGATKDFTLKGDLLGSSGAGGPPPVGAAAAAAAAGPGAAPRGVDLALSEARHKGSARAGRAEEWRSTTSVIANTAITAKSDDVAFAVRDAMKEGFRVRFEAFILERTYRFPVLAHWSFTCNGAGSLDTILQELDVGLLGTLPGPDAKPPRPVCLPEVTGDAPPAAPAPRPEPEVAESGHVGLPHTTRDGESRRAWYRGPLTPHATRRNALGRAGGTVLAHVSDQLRAVIPDGREDLSLAVAFEIGRLLALSRPSVVAALMRWRREQFGAHRSRRLSNRLLEEIDFAKLGLEVALNSDIYRAVGSGFVRTVVEKPEKVLADPRPIADPGRPIRHLSGDPIEDLSRGLALNRTVLKGLLETNDLTQLDSTAVPLASTPAEGPRPAELRALRETLDSTVDALIEDAGLEDAGLDDRGVLREARRDTLRRLIDLQARLRNEEMK